jgi:hypothetical protein
MFPVFKNYLTIYVGMNLCSNTAQGNFNPNVLVCPYVQEIFWN